jgi:hypothetical protein
MSRFEKAYVIAYLLLSAAYIPTLFAERLGGIGAVHVVWTVAGAPFLVMVFADVYHRDFANPNDKVTWVILMVMLGPIGIVVYLYKHGFRSRRRHGNGTGASGRGPGGDRGS